VAKEEKQDVHIKEEALFSMAISVPSA